MPTSAGWRRFGFVSAVGDTLGHVQVGQRGRQKRREGGGNGQAEGNGVAIGRGQSMDGGTSIWELKAPKDEV